MLRNVGTEYHSSLRKTPEERSSRKSLGIKQTIKEDKMQKLTLYVSAHVSPLWRISKFYYEGKNFDIKIR